MRKLFLVLLGVGAIAFALSKFGDFLKEVGPGEGSAVAVRGALAPCEVGTPASGVFAVKGEYELHAGPSASSPVIVNQKATAALGQTHYQIVDQSQTVRKKCQEADWTLVQVVTPEWLTNVSGWLPSEGVRDIPRSPDGQRTYVADDFYWDSDTKQFKNQLVAVVNRVSRENAGCALVDTGTLSKSSSRSKPNDPVFFITCGSGAEVFNVWFRPSDAVASASFAAIAPVEQSTAISLCRSAATSAAVHPSTVNMDALATAYDAHPSGRATVLSKFRAKNGLGLELTYNIKCLFEGPSLIETSIWEVGT